MGNLRWVINLLVGVPMKIEFTESNYVLLNEGKSSTVRLGTKTKYIDYIGKGVILHDNLSQRKAMITEVSFKMLGELTLGDAKLDGFNSVEELGYELARCYNEDLFYYTKITIIKFVLI